MSPVKVSGFRELGRALEELPKATGKNVLVRTGKKALEPVEARAKRLVPVDEGHLRDSITTGTRLNRKQAQGARREGPSFAEVHTGTGSRNGVPREFGTWRTRATPFLRPAWDSEKDGVLVTVKYELGTEIEKAAARLARKRGK